MPGDQLAARHRNQPTSRLFALRILLIAPTLVIVTIAARLISALLVLPIALGVTLLMLLAIVLMLVVSLIRILMLRVLVRLIGVIGVVLALFVAHDMTPYRLIIQGFPARVFRPMFPALLVGRIIEGRNALHKKPMPRISSGANFGLDGRSD
jgi:hypothetical protein